MELEMARTMTEFDTVYKYALITPLSLLAIFRQYDYLILYKELRYIDNIETLADLEEFDILH